ncbi:MAG: transposase [Acidobacteria bacterium]|nr:transposase [Acidobacteriota bacterium]
MEAKSVPLGPSDRALALEAIQSECEHESWTLHAAHVRSTHVHVVVAAQVPPEQVMGKLKAYASRALNRADGQTAKRWARHGSTIYLWTAAQVYDAVEYVYTRQGEPMARFLNAWLWPQFVD